MPMAIAALLPVLPLTFERCRSHLAASMSSIHLLPVPPRSSFLIRFDAYLCVYLMYSYTYYHCRLLPLYKYECYTPLYHLCIIFIIGAVRFQQSPEMKMEPF